MEESPSPGARGPRSPRRQPWSPGRFRASDSRATFSSRAGRERSLDCGALGRHGAPSTWGWGSVRQRAGPRGGAECERGRRRAESGERRCGRAGRPRVRRRGRPGPVRVRRRGVRCGVRPGETVRGAEVRGEVVRGLRWRGRPEGEGGRGWGRGRDLCPGAEGPGGAHVRPPWCPAWAPGLVWPGGPCSWERRSRGPGRGRAWTLQGWAPGAGRRRGGERRLLV